jgi:CubicO group peptidase (beta-lactamase class C family)
MVLGGAIWGVIHFDASPLRAVTGFVSHTLCSGAFVSGLNPDQVYADTLKPMAGIEKINPAIAYEVDLVHHEVKTRLVGLFESSAVFHDGLGCILVHRDEPTRMPPAAPPGAEREVTAPLVEEIAGPAAIEPSDSRLRAALDRAFAEPDRGPLRRTAAVVVVHDGRIVAERYAPGYRVDTPLLGWSVTKSVVNALIGVLVRDRRLSIDGPAPVAQWRDPSDPRHAITIDNLLRMTSGLDLDETNRDYDAVTRMLTVESDMARFAEGAKLKVPPGTKWEYTSGNTLILSRIIRDAVGGGPSEVLAFARQELFEPLGMRNITLEFDAAGTPIGSTYMYASARDWARFGMLFLNDGVVNGRRILPEGWLRYSSSQTLGSPYSAGFWLGSSTWRAHWGLPRDAFFASGLLGQRVMVIPSEQLVIARFGNAHGPGYDMQGFGQLVSDVVETLKQP